jgi:DNA-binding beta-propeller fold protein YncE
VRSRHAPRSRLTRIPVALCTIIAVAVPLASTALVLDGAPAGAGTATPTAYAVTYNGFDTMTPIDTTTNTAGTPIPVGAYPDAIAIAPNGQTAYVVDGAGAAVTPVDLSTGNPGTPIPVGTGPDAIAIAPDGQTAYVVSDPGPEGTVTPIDLDTDTPGTPIPAGNYPGALAITPDGQTAYVANGAAPCNTENCTPDTTVTPIDLTTDTAGTPIPVGAGPSAIAVTPNGQTAYVVNGDSGSVTPIATATDTPESPILLGGDGDDVSIAIAPNGQTAYVGGATFGTADTEGNSTVTPIDIATNTPGTPISFGTGDFNASAIAITPDGQTAYAIYQSGLATPIDLATDTVGTPISLGSSPGVAIAITPDQAPTAAFSFSAGEPGNPTSFDASASSSPFGSIASYAWNFGDGNTETTTSPTTTHTYAAPGPYSVTLTVTNTQGTSTTQTFTGQTVSNDGGPSATVTQTVTVPAGTCAAPEITSDATATALAGQPFSFTVTTCSTSVPVIRGSGFPTGMRLVNNGNGTALIGGTPYARDNGRYTATITATVASEPVATQSFVLSVDNPGVFTSLDRHADTTGGPFSFAVTTAYAFPVPSITSTALPDGVTLTDNRNGTATLSAAGPIPEGGVYVFTLISDNGVTGSPVTQTFTLTLDQAPPALAPIANTTVPALFAMTPIPVSATGYPAPTLRATGLPAGLRLSGGEIEGTAALEGGEGTTTPFAVTVTATNRAGSASVTFVLSVYNTPYI